MGIAMKNTFLNQRMMPRCGYLRNILKEPKYNDNTQIEKLSKK